MTRKSSIVLLFCLVLVAVLCPAGGAWAELVAHWKLDESSGTTAYDSVGGLHGAMANMDPLSAWVGGKINGCVSLDGVDDHVSLPASFNLNSSSMTISLWLKSNADQNSFTGLVFRRTHDENATGFGFSRNTNELGYHWNNTQFDWSSGVIIPNGVWLFAAISIAPTQATVYVSDTNTGELRSAANAHELHTESFNNAAIGADIYWEGGRYFNGLIDDVRIWNTALSPEEINDVYTGGAVTTVEFEAESSISYEPISSAVVPVVLRNGIPDQSYAVSYTVTGGTATGGGVDYTLESGTLDFGPGETVKPINISVINDGVQEPDETIALELSNPDGPGAVLGIAQHTHTISDAIPQIGFANATGSTVENVTPAVIEVMLSYASNEAITVNYAVTGGTAKGGGVDYTLTGGSLQFEPGTVTKYITMQIVDDDMTETDKTVILRLSNPTNATLGTERTHTFTIFDDEWGVVWDDKIWYYTSEYGGPFVNEDGNLEWTPEEEGQYVTRIPEQSLAWPGDKVEVSYMWMTDGATPCNVDDCYSCPRCTGDIRCVAGTSDFRIGLFQADGEYAERDGGWDLKDTLWEGYVGYNFRFGPNMRAEPTRYVDCDDETHKTGNFAKKDPEFMSLMTANQGLMDYIPGFELPPGEWSLLTVSLERVSRGIVEFSITLNGRTYTETDSGSPQPTKIDVFAIHMRNNRPFYKLVLAKLGCSCPGNLDGGAPQAAQIDLEDLQILAGMLLDAGSPFVVPVEAGHCGDLNADLQIDLEDLQALASVLLDGGSPFIVPCE